MCVCGGGVHVENGHIMYVSHLVMQQISFTVATLAAAARVCPARAGVLPLCPPYYIQ